MIDIQGYNSAAFPIATLKSWLIRLAESHSSKISRLTYYFVDDDEILRINREHLNHDYITDIITFDYSINKKITGEVFISYPQLLRQAKVYNVTLENETLRVMAHGLLHIIGFNDQTDGEKLEMRAEEDKALLLHAQIQK